MNFNDPTGHVVAQGAGIGGACDADCQLRRRLLRNEAKLKDNGGQRSPGSNESIHTPKQETNNSNGAQNICTGTPPYKRAFSCQAIYTEPAIVTPAVVQSPVVTDTYTDYGPENPPTVNGQTFTPAYGGNQRAISGLELFLMVADFVHYNTNFYSSQTGTNAQGMIPVLHHNESGQNIIPGVGVYNNTGMNLNVSQVKVNEVGIPISKTLISDGELGAVNFDTPLTMPSIDIVVNINFRVVQNDGNLLGYGQITYNGPNYYPPRP